MEYQNLAHIHMPQQYHFHTVGYAKSFEDVTTSKRYEIAAGALFNWMGIQNTNFLKYEYSDFDFRPTSIYLLKLNEY